MTKRTPASLAEHIALYHPTLPLMTPAQELVFKIDFCREHSIFYAEQVKLLVHELLHGLRAASGATVSADAFKKSLDDYSASLPKAPEPKASPCGCNACYSSQVCGGSERSPHCEASFEVSGATADTAHPSDCQCIGCRFARNRSGATATYVPVDMGIFGVLPIPAEKFTATELAMKADPITRGDALFAQLQKEARRSGATEEAALQERASAIPPHAPATLCTQDFCLRGWRGGEQCGEYCAEGYNAADAEAAAKEQLHLVCQCKKCQSDRECSTSKAGAPLSDNKPPVVINITPAHLSEDDQLLLRQLKARADFAALIESGLQYKKGERA